MSVRTTTPPRRTATARRTPTSAGAFAKRIRPPALPHELEVIDALRTRLVADLEQLTAAANDKDPTGSDFDSMVTAAQSSMRFETDDILRSRIERRLVEVRKVEARLHAGTYGVCDTCGGDIDPERLEAIPDTTHCMPCQVASERKAGVRSAWHRAAELHVSTPGGFPVLSPSTGKPHPRHPRAHVVATKGLRRRLFAFATEQRVEQGTADDRAEDAEEGKSSKHRQSSRDTTS